ncbi:MAG TPA: neutral/alkaline non-lysosomal ceramidase N-terminal domain-containing protein, partial [Chryseosolibacter sp.]|nr:neutral/alkaline non-lysosomal ceramidase N-terminal domain-containing protein [Chryseosolibacter sp.]
MFRIFLRYVALTLVGIVAFLLIFILISVAPVDRTPVRETTSYEEMMKRLDHLEIEIPDPESGFSTGFGKANITPSQPMATAGYGKRRGKPYEEVRDSIFVRAMVISNGAAKVAIVSADLLIMPPTVTRVLETRLPEIGFSLENTYLAATHSHNSIGHWGEGATRFIYGAYEDSVVTFLVDGIISSIQKANSDLLPSKLKTGDIAVPTAVENRLIDGGKEDPYLRVIEIHRSDSSKNVLVTYAAHATCLSQGTLALSRDYPGMLVDALEDESYSFAMFLAGAVGSHKGSSPVNNWDCMAWMANEVSQELFSQRENLKTVQDTALVMERVALPLSDPQVKISQDWKVRAWLFSAAFGDYDATLAVLRIGDIVMLGTPCDFSGEFMLPLDSLADSLGVQAIVTSFNGGYIGYVTPGKYYDVDHYETQLMNWYAPGTGDYIEKCLE